MLLKKLLSAILTFSLIFVGFTGGTQFVFAGQLGSNELDLLLQQLSKVRQTGLNKDESLVGFADLSEEERKFVQKELSKHGAYLPRAKAGEDGNSVQFSYSDLIDLDLVVVDASRGHFLINGQFFQWNAKKSFQDNVSFIFKNFIERKVREEHSNRFLGKKSLMVAALSLLIPSAHAEEASEASSHGADDSEFDFKVPLNPDELEGVKSESSEISAEEEVERKRLSKGQKWAIGIGAALIVGLVAYLIYKNNKDKDEARAEARRLEQERLEAARRAEEARKAAQHKTEKGGTIDGPGNFLWKPVSESNGNLVVLLPREYNDQISSVTVNGEAGSFAGDTHNGNRSHWRYPKPGAAYGNDVEVKMNLNDGNSRTWNIPTGAKRWD